MGNETNTAMVHKTQGQQRQPGSAVSSDSGIGEGEGYNHNSPRPKVIVLSFFRGTH